ncbi:MAG: nitrous oxide reductase accessory protein NosL [Coriobacteriales bacterium]|jgi:copper chaperone NosL|nr:nitrous oxide reductase accessory protein NosL [Coriobacteriales bacterium]
MKKRISFVAVLLFVVALTGCVGGAGLAPKPIDEKVDVCANCSMTVMDNQFAAQIVVDAKTVDKFDDIACMAVYIVKGIALEGTCYVRDFYSLEWVSTETALFASSEKVMTPMNSGFVAFADKSSLDAFLAEYTGEEVSWADVMDTMKMRREMMSTDDNGPMGSEMMLH